MRAYNQSMSRPQILVLLGCVVALGPFLGLPISWLEILMPVVGVIIISIAYSFLPRKEKIISSTTRDSEQTVAV